MLNMQRRSIFGNKLNIHAERQSNVELIGYE